MSAANISCFRKAPLNITTLNKYLIKNYSINLVTTLNKFGN